MLKSIIESRKGAVLSASAMYMYVHYLKYENLPNNDQKQLKW